MSLQHAILGFLSLQPFSGYDLKRVFDQTVGHFWVADQAQIYRTLARLADEGMIDVDPIEQEGKPDRNEHRLTQAGKVELDQWLATAHETQTSRRPFLLQLFFAGRLQTPEIRRLLQHRVAETMLVEATLNEIGSTLEKHAGDTMDLPQRLRLATVHNGLAHARAEIAWATRLLGDLAGTTEAEAS